MLAGIPSFVGSCCRVCSHHMFSFPGSEVPSFLLAVCYFAIVSLFFLFSTAVLPQCTWSPDPQSCQSSATHYSKTFHPFFCLYLYLPALTCLPWSSILPSSLLKESLAHKENTHRHHGTKWWQLHLHIFSYPPSSISIPEASHMILKSSHKTLSCVLGFMVYNYSRAYLWIPRAYHTSYQIRVP